MDPIAKHKKELRSLARYVHSKKIPKVVRVGFAARPTSARCQDIACPSPQVDPSQEQQRLVMDLQQAISAYHRKNLSAQIRIGLAARRRRLQMAAKLKDVA